MSVQNGRAFNEWLRTQLKAKKMSQRQLAQQSGVDHSTISRLVRGDRTPSLGTATKLARGLRELRDETETPHYFGLVAASTSHPTARVEYALRSDDLLSEPQVRQVMEYYLALRMRRLAAARQNGAVDAARYDRSPRVAIVRGCPTATSSSRRRADRLAPCHSPDAGPQGPASSIPGRDGIALVRRSLATPRSSVRATRLRLVRQHVGDAAEDDDRQHADGTVDER